jgi:hypothetical protein
MTDAQLIEKFRGLAGRKLSAARLDHILDRVWRIDSDREWATLLDELRIEER